MNLTRAEDSLKAVFRNIAIETSYSRRDSLNTVFYKMLKAALAVQSSYSYPFDSIRIGKLKSPDERFRVFTWNIPQPGGYQQYFGLMQVKNPDGTFKLIELSDSRKRIADAKNEKLTADRWMAALYYQVARFKTGAGNTYILLGYDFNNLFTSKKIIEVLTFDNLGNPTFGYPVFNVDGKYRLSRIVFEFNARVSMVLRYNEDSKTIVFDHLSPSSPEFAGDFQYYGPDGSFDGFKLEGSEWVYVRDLDMRNPRRSRPKPVNAPVDIKEPGFLYRPNGNSSTRK
ncbi:MAG: hypothetical protein AB1777_01070 [Bacteroidota bacterium]